jgi:hypothetical protein
VVASKSPRKMRATRRVGKSSAAAVQAVATPHRTTLSASHFAAGMRWRR